MFKLTLSAATAAFCLCITGCVSQNHNYRKDGDNKLVYKCQAEGFGIFGATRANNFLAECQQNAAKLGYVNE